MCENSQRIPLAKGKISEEKSVRKFRWINADVQRELSAPKIKNHRRNGHTSEYLHVREFFQKGSFKTDRRSSRISTSIFPSFTIPARIVRRRSSVRKFRPSFCSNKQQWLEIRIIRSERYITFFGNWGYSCYYDSVDAKSNAFGANFSTLTAVLIRTRERISSISLWWFENILFVRRTINENSVFHTQFEFTRDHLIPLYRRVKFVNQKIKITIRIKDKIARDLIIPQTTWSIKS